MGQEVEIARKGIGNIVKGPGPCILPIEAENASEDLKAIEDKGDVTGGTCIGECGRRRDGVRP